MTQITPNRFYYTATRIDSVTGPLNWFQDIKTQKRTEDIIVEIATINLTSNEKTEYELTHFIMNQQIVRTKNKLLRGVQVEGLDYNEITYQYKDGLLIKANVTGRHSSYTLDYIYSR